MHLPIMDRVAIPETTFVRLLVFNCDNEVVSIVGFQQFHQVGVRPHGRFWGINTHLLNLSMHSG